MNLPVLTRALEASGITASHADAVGAVEFGALCGTAPDVTLPVPPDQGEQYRFHFDMTKCIGCKCCVVACNEQNGNPADILWRRVGEIEGGTYPHTVRHYLSMGCNHCLEPTCLQGCPVDAYTKDEATGIVRHNADACIGCQYCTWNCSYGVPQYNPERGVVGKCDMCYGRLTQGQLPACVNACPEGAIRIETVKVAEWRRDYSEGGANSPGMPSADDSLSTTRITRPAKMPDNIGKVNLDFLHPEHPHTPLIVMTVLTQLSVGGFTSIWLLQALGTQTHRIAALVALAVASLALGASTLHLGRPIHAIRALKMWRRSWLSREVLFFTLFTHAAAAYAGTLWFNWKWSTELGGLTALFGVAGVLASARLYLAPGRPAWNTPLTIVEYLLTTFLLGSCGANVLTHSAPAAVLSTLCAGTLAFALSLIKLLRFARSPRHELRGTWQLLTTVLANKLWLRYALLLCSLLTLAFSNSWICILTAALALSSEFMGRYLFFVSVVPTNMATDYFAGEAA